MEMASQILNDAVRMFEKFLVESIGSSIRADLLNASAVQSSAADGLVVADGLLLAIESTLTARVDGLLGDPSMLSPIITSNYIQESHLPDVVSGPGDLLAPSCFNGRSRGLQRDIRAKKKGLQPQGVASVPDNRSSSSNSVLGRKARKPKAMIYTCSLPEVDVEKRALMQGKEVLFVHFCSS
ncbi:hypothetical protein Tco_0492312 [Tanacetum coccineum]